MFRKFKLLIDVFDCPVGVFEKQIYIQTTEKLRKDISHLAYQFQHGGKLIRALPRVKWAPYIASCE